MGVTVVDQLMVTLGLDPKAYFDGKKRVDAGLKDTRENSKKTRDEIENLGKSGAQAMKTLKNEVLSLGAALLGAAGIKEFASKIITSDEALGRLAKNVGADAGIISAWQGVAERAGGSAEGMAGAFQNMASQMQGYALTGQASMIPFLYQAQVNVAKFLDVSTPMPERLMLLADAFERMDPAKAQYLGKGMGFDEGTINVLMNGRDALAALLVEQEKLGHATAEQTAQAKKLKSAWRGLSQAATTLGRDMLYTLGPALEGTLGFMTRLTHIGSDLGIAMYELLHPSASLPGGATDEAAYDAKLGQGGAGSVAMWRRTMGIRSGRADANYGNEGRNWRPGSGLPRGIRNNNPGNLDFVGQTGAELEGGVGAGARFARFNSMAEGVAALASQLQVYQARGVDTIKSIIERYAPPAENNTGAYVASVSKALGIGADQHLDLKNVAVLREMIAAISNVENGPGRLGVDQINAGLSLYTTRGARGGSSTTDVKIGSIVVHTQATDAQGIARDIGPALQRHGFAMQANTGLDY